MWTVYVFETNGHSTIVALDEPEVIGRDDTGIGYDENFFLVVELRAESL